MMNKATLLALGLGLSCQIGCSGHPTSSTTRVRTDAAPIRTVHGRGVLFDNNGTAAGCVDDGTKVTQDGAPFGVLGKWGHALSDGTKTAVWIYLPDASTCDGQPNPPQGHFVINMKTIADPPPPPSRDHDTERLAIRNITLRGDAGCTQGALDLSDINADGDDVAIAGTGINVGWQDEGDGELSAQMNCTVTMTVQAQPGYYIRRFHGILTGGIADGTGGSAGQSSVTVTAAGSVGVTAIPALSVSGSGAPDGSGGLQPLVSPATDDIDFPDDAATQCAPGAAATAVELDASVSVTRNNVMLTPLGSFDGYDFAFATDVCPTGK